FEATFVHIDKENIRKKLDALSASIVHKEYIMKRMVFHPPVESKGSWMRVRQEANIITMSYKKVTGNNIEDQKESLVTVTNFDDAVQFLESIGARKKAYQENKRELWKLNEVEITIDTWPGLLPYIEIEARSEKLVQQVTKQLGFEYKEAIFGAADEIYYRELGVPKSIINDHTPEITFQHPPKKYVA
ncbi:MAG: hypothetical protein COU30_01010, partial [Candidatus Magasanikbacteria bacterium CG10_big_fil_rev_8_21_14_0_10_38_6]